MFGVVESELRGCKVSKELEVAMLGALVSAFVHSEKLFTSVFDTLATHHTTMAPSRASALLKPLLTSPAYRLPQVQRTAAPIASFCNGQTLRSFTTTRCQREEAEKRTSSSINDDISSLLDGTLDLTKGTPSTPASRTSRFKSRDAQQSNGARGAANELEQARSSNRSSVDDLLEGMVNRSAGEHRRRATSSYNSSDIYDMFSGDSGQPTLTKEAEPVHLPPNVGRLVAVDDKRGVDVARAFRTMEIQCNRNRVKRSFAQQRFHERPGLKRKRLKNERWIKRFKENFKGTVQLVQKMKKQGW